MRLGRRARVLLLVAATLALALGVSAVVVTTVRRDDSCASDRRNAEAAPASGGVSAGPVAFFLGDSYTTGFGLPDPGEGFAYGLADLEGWNATVEGFPGTGYATQGPCGGNAFIQRLARLPADADVVIIEGGLNDAIFGVPPATLAADASGLLAAVRMAAPDARIVVLGAADVLPEARSRVLAANAALRAVASDAGATYVDLADLEFTTTDGKHPTVAGHALIAEAVSDALH